MNNQSIIKEITISSTSYQKTNIEIMRGIKNTHPSSAL
jgi:hypothetical protein